MIKKFKKSMMSLAISVGCLLGATSIYAQEGAIQPIPANLNTQVSIEFTNPNSFPEITTFGQLGEDDNSDNFIEAPEELKASAANSDISLLASSVAEMRIFADSSDDVESSVNTSGHAFLTIKNISSSEITVGGLKIKPNKTLSIGTFGNRSENKGLWYNLESYYAYHEDAFTNAVSMRVILDDSLLSTVSKNIINNDSWTLTNNCSSFATKIWNSVCSDTLSAGTPKTPDTLKTSMKKYGSSYYTIGATIPYDYVVYYGHPATRSNTY